MSHLLSPNPDPDLDPRPPIPEPEPDPDPDADPDPNVAWLGFMGKLLRDPEGGSDTIAYLASPKTDISGSGINGAYLWDRRARSVDLMFSGTEAR